MFASVRKNPERLQAIEKVTEWTRARFGLPKEAAISVAEVACALPGCAPLETVVMFWVAEQRYQEVVADDLPYAWLRDALAVQDGAGWDCC